MHINCITTQQWCKWKQIDAIVVHGCALWSSDLRVVQLSHCTGINNKDWLDWWKHMLKNRLNIALPVKNCFMKIGMALYKFIETTGELVGLNLILVINTKKFISNKTANIYLSADSFMWSTKTTTTTMQVLFPIVSVAITTTSKANIYDLWLLTIFFTV